MRVSKTVNGVKTEYVWDGSSLIGQKTGNNVLVYLYAADGLAGFQYNGVNYYYLKNGQGDVVGILDSSGTLVAKYTYDAWGKLLSVTDATGADKSADSAFIGNINPVRYRSYYYDTETGVYYLQSRYYDPEVGRFINADGILGANGSILAYNLFAYCGNNPIRRSDPNGCFFIADDVLGGIIIAIVVLFAASEIIVYSQSAPTWGNNALKLPELPQLDSDNEDKILKFPVPPITFSDIAPPVSVPKPAPGNKDNNSSEGAYFQIVDLKNKEWNVRGTYTRDAIVEKIKMIDAAGIYTKRNSWGVYTPLQQDAIWLASTLAALNGTGFFEETKLLEGNKRHYHMEGHVFFNKYEHFHIWFN